MNRSLWLLLCLELGCVSAKAIEYDLDLPKQFIQTYDLTKRDTHEYNPYTLRKTRESFLQLEQSLRTAGFALEGRFGIFGYQEEAIPPYTTNWERIAIEDEVIVKANGGFSQPTKNVFGFMTGFLLKDAQWMQNSWFGDQQPQIKHVLARPIDIFNDSSLIFQKHAFGVDYDLLIAKRDNIERLLYTRNLKAVLAELIDFWQIMQERSTKTGSDEAVASQDMLFSIDYARALMDGSAEVKKFFLGPDITYPIEVLSCQKAEATVHAQDFIKKMDQELVSCNDANTVYIFCSFVDGVGKSTLLNNIRNWSKYKDSFDQYERCDNSSSQEATLFQLKDKVFIADLPAQISHFVIKPDGFVYADIHTVKGINPELVAELEEYASKNKQQLTDNFEKLKTKIIAENKALYETTNPNKQFAHNCLLLESESAWIPFKHAKQYFLFDKQNPKQLRMLVPIANAHSTGLKVIEPQQMLFSKGLSLPMRYEAFVQDLIYKLKQAHIERVIFVDFLSMYPRSSRENIRLNFILQYLKKVFSSRYSVAHSFYQPRIHDAQETCYLLTHHLDDAIEALVLETALRWALDLLLAKVTSDKLGNITGLSLEQNLKELSSYLLEHYGKELYSYAYERLEPEQATYYAHYQLDRIYQTIVNFSAVPVIELSKILVGLFSQRTNHPYFTNGWSNLMARAVAEPTPDIPLPAKAQLENGTAVDIVSCIPNTCKDEVALRRFVRNVRAQWYAALSNLLAGIYTDDYFEFEAIAQPVPPLVVHTYNGFLYGLQKSLPLIDMKAISFKNSAGLAIPGKFNVVGKARSWGLFEKLPHYLDWNPINTNTGLFSYSYQESGKKNVISRLVQKFRQWTMQAGKPNMVLPTQSLHSMLSETDNLAAFQAEFKSKTYETIKADDPRIPSLQLWVRMIATLDMVLKDPEAKIIVRKGNREDFVAAIHLLELITLPYYFGIKAEGPLFDDYSAVEPVISWQIINHR